MCVPTCQKVDDCCPNPPCDKGMMPFKCENNLCKLAGCTTDADCKTPGVTLTCKQVTLNGKPLGVCGMWCTKDTDCTVQGMKCVVEVEGASSKTCGMPCTKDAECIGMKCIKNTYCGPDTASKNKCTADTDCASNKAGLTVCDTSSGQCVCASDQTCNDAMKATGKTFKCTSDYL